MSFSIDQIIELNIQNLGNSGEGVGYYDGTTVFVEGGLPEETLLVKIKEKKKNYAIAQLVNIIRPSSQRISPSCPIFKTCGGCQLMHLNYEAQLIAKERKVREALRRIGGLEQIPVLPCQPSPQTLGYRNKIQLAAFSKNEGISLGMYAKGTHENISIEQCMIHSSVGEDILPTLKDLLNTFSITAYCKERKEGELRHILIRSTVKHHEVLVVFICNGPPSTALLEVSKQLLEKFPTVKGVVANINQRHDNVILGKTFITLCGKETITETLLGMEFHVSAASFFQVNPLQAEALYLKVIELAQPNTSDTILDCYCGVGTMSLLFASQGTSVIGIESVPEAIEDAKANAETNGIRSCEFICGFAEKVLRHVKPFECALLNPPRKGCDKNLLIELLRRSPPQIIYVSCDPATLARDVKILVEGGYRAECAVPFDMFPQTAHVETVLKLQKVIT